MNEELQSGIYVWMLNGVPKYVGQAINVKRRMLHKHYNSKILVTAIKKYGYESFEKKVVIYCNVSELDAYEIYYIKELKTHFSQGGYNISLGGDSPMRGRKHSEETINKLSGKSKSKETREKISKTKKEQDLSGEKNPAWGRKHTEEEKKIMSENHVDFSGVKNPVFGKKLPNSSSEYYGVYKKKDGKYNYWQASITVNGKYVFIKQLRIEKEAAIAYDDFIVENNLPNPLNFPENYK